MGSRGLVSVRSVAARRGERTASRKQRRQQPINATIDAIAECGLSGTRAAELRDGAGDRPR